jgi:hypothetical protein
MGWIITAILALELHIQFQEDCLQSETMGIVAFFVIVSKGSTINGMKQPQYFRRIVKGAGKKRIGMKNRTYC